MDEVLDFIKRRWKKDANWDNGNCLWFAIILYIRFPESQIYYLPIKGHFISKYQDVFYDWKGEYIPEEKPILFDSIYESDPVWYARLIRDCLK